MITLETEFVHEPKLTTATLIHCVVTDFLVQKQFQFWNLPELVDIATVATGLGLLLSDFSFVEKNLRMGEVTEWRHTRKGFLDQKSLAYTFALAAWVRDQPKPSWANGMRADVRGPMKKALRFLYTTNDSFFRAESAESGLLSQPQEHWLRAAASGGNSEQIIAIRQFINDPRRTDDQSAILVEKLRGRNQAIVLNAIWAAEQTKNDSPEVVAELRELIDSPEDDIRAKAVTTLAILGAMDDDTISRAAKMLGSGGPYIEYAAAYSLASLPSVPDHVLLPMNKGMLRALQGCNYGLVAHFVAAFDRWIDKPEEYFAKVLAEDGPEYLEIVMETLDQHRDRLVQLKEKAG